MGLYRPFRNPIVSKPVQLCATFKVVLLVSMSRTPLAASRCRGSVAGWCAGCGTCWPRRVVDNDVGHRQRQRHDDRCCPQAAAAARPARRPLQRKGMAGVEICAKAHIARACSYRTERALQRAAHDRTVGSCAMCMDCAYAACERAAACCVRTVYTITLRACM